MDGPLGRKSKRPRWTTPANLRERLQRRWDRGELPSTVVGGDLHFPLEITLTRPRARDIAERFGAVMDWVAAWQAEERSSRGFGYELRLQLVRNRVHGTNELPVAAIFPTEQDALRFIGRWTEAKRLRTLASTIRARQPALAEWLIRRPREVLRHSDEWDSLLAVVDWFAAHPRPGLYLRQLDIPGVDTKFIEGRRGVLMELLDEVLPPAAVDRSATGAGRFVQRYGLKEEPSLVRFRILDEALTISGFTDLTVTMDEFARLPIKSRTSDLPVERVFITENRINGLAFPPRARSLVIFGLGYGVEGLAMVPWLQDVGVSYWGDIDTHGFGILNRLRSVIPHAQSFLMDRDTLMAHPSLWVQEPANKRYEGEPAYLTDDEYALFDDLRADRLGERVRLEQERIPFGWVERRLIF